MYSAWAALDYTVRLNFPVLWNIPQLVALECLVVAKFQNPSPVAATTSALNISERKMSMMEDEYDQNNGY
jgi:hypothetical protein